MAKAATESERTRLCMFHPVSQECIHRTPGRHGNSPGGSGAFVFSRRAGQESVPKACCARLQAAFGTDSKPRPGRIGSAVREKFARIDAQGGVARPGSCS